MSIFNVIARLILSSIIISSCINPTNEHIQIYGNVNQENLKRISVLDIDQFRSFEEASHRVQQIVCNDSIPAIIDDHSGNRKIICLINHCEKITACTLFKNRNILEIIDGQVVNPNPSTQNSLFSIMNNHYNNHSSSPAYSEAPEQFVISLSCDKNSIKTFKKMMNQIVRSYDSIQTSAPLNIYMGKIFPPPPSILLNDINKFD